MKIRFVYAEKNTIFKILISYAKVVIEYAKPVVIILIVNHVNQTELCQIVIVEQII